MPAVAGCSSKSKQSHLMATQNEEILKQRWIARRMNDLMAGKQAADAREARRIATEEFKQKFAATTIAQDPEAMANTPR